MTDEKAFVLCREIAEALGGEQQEAIEHVVTRLRELTRGKKPSQQFTAPVTATDHFRKATEELANPDEIDTRKIKKP